MKRLYGGQNLETLVHGGVILASVGLVGFGLAGFRRPPHAPLGRYPMALVLASVTVVVGTLLIRRIDVLAVRGFEEPWLQVLLGFNVAFLSLLFLVQARRATPSFGEAAEDAWVVSPTSSIGSSTTAGRPDEHRAAGGIAARRHPTSPRIHDHRSYQLPAAQKPTFGLEAPRAVRGINGPWTSAVATETRSRARSARACCCSRSPAWSS